MTQPISAPDEQVPSIHEVAYESTNPRGGRVRREHSVIVCSCHKRFSATGPTATTQNYTRAKYNQHLAEFGQPEVFNDLQEGSANLLVEDPTTGNKRWIVDGGVDLGQVNEALDGSGPVELAPPSDLESLNPEA